MKLILLFNIFIVLNCYNITKVIQRNKIENPPCARIKDIKCNKVQCFLHISIDATFSNFAH